MSEALEKALSGARYAVVDASLIFDSLLGDDARIELANRFIEVCRQSGVLLIAPPSFAGEVDTAFRQAIHRRGFPESELPAVFEALDELPIRLILDESELRATRHRARELAAMLNQPSVYDCTYAALAEARGCDFWTADKTFANVARQKRRKPDGTTAPTLSNVQLMSIYADE